jgi:hypothetical protein
MNDLSESYEVIPMLCQAMSSVNKQISWIYNQQNVCIEYFFVLNLIKLI